MGHWLRRRTDNILAFCKYRPIAVEWMFCMNGLQGEPAAPRPNTSASRLWNGQDEIREVVGSVADQGDMEVEPSTWNQTFPHPYWRCNHIPTPLLPRVILGRHQPAHRADSY